MDFVYDRGRSCVFMLAENQPDAGAVILGADAQYTYGAPVQVPDEPPTARLPGTMSGIVSAFTAGVQGAWNVAANALSAPSQAPAPAREQAPSQAQGAAPAQGAASGPTAQGPSSNSANGTGPRAPGVHVQGAAHVALALNDATVVVETSPEAGPENEDAGPYSGPKPKGNKRSELGKPDTGIMTLAYKVRGGEADCDATDGEQWPPRQDGARYVKSIAALHDSHEIKIMASFLLQNGLTRGAYATAKTDWYGYPITRWPTLDCVKADGADGADGGCVLLYNTNKTDGYEVIRTGREAPRKLEARMVVKQDNGAPGAYRDYTLDKDVVDYVSSVYAIPKLDGVTEQQLKCMVFLLLTSSGWGCYARNRVVWLNHGKSDVSLWMQNVSLLMYRDGDNEVTIAAN